MYALCGMSTFPARASRWRRAALGLAGGLLLLLVAALLGLDLAAAWIVERGGHAALGVRVKVARASVSLLSGELGLEGLEIANPPGFSQRPVLSVGRLRVSVSRRALGQDPLTVDAIEASGVLVQVEAAGGLTNLEALRRNAQAFAASQQGPDPRRVLVRLLRVRGSRASAELPVPGRPRATVPLKDLELRDVGREHGGLTPSQVVQLVARLMEPGARNALRSTDLRRLGGQGAQATGRKLRGLFR